MLLLFGFVVFLVLSCVVYVVYIVCNKNKTENKKGRPI